MAFDDRHWRTGFFRPTTGRPENDGARRPGPPWDAAKAVASAVAVASNGVRPVGAGRLAHPDPQWRLAVAEALELLLARSVTALWRRGWQPNDLHRLARKRSKWSADVVRDAIAAELAGYARATVDPRYWSQLDELEARCWWAGDSGHLRARSDDASWSRIVAGAVEAAAVFLNLPEVEQHWPSPGHSRAGVDNAATDIDDRILSRVRNLLAKAESTTFEAEAESFTAAAQSLMARHSIDLALVAAQGQRSPGDAPHGLRIGLDNPYEHAKALLLDVVARANNCRTVWSKQWSYSTVVGFPAELIGVQNLFTSLLVQATAALQREGSRVRRDGSSRTRSFRASFLMSYATRIGERLQEATDDETARAGAEAAASGQDLLPVLASRRRETDDAFERMFPETTQVRTAMTPDHGGWAAGRAAADVARLAAGAEIRD